MSKFSDFIRNTDPEAKRRIYEEAMRAAAEHQVMTISRAKSMAISQRGRQAILDAEEVNFDLDRMKRAVEDGEYTYVVIPPGLSTEEICEWIRNHQTRKQEPQP